MKVWPLRGKSAASLDGVRRPPVQGGARRPCVESLENRVLLSGETHTGGLVSGAFGGGSGSSGPTLHLVIIPNTTPKASQAVLGTFGAGAKSNKLVVSTSDGTQATFTASGGTVSAFGDGNGIRLEVQDSGRGVSLNVTSRGGSGLVMLTDVTVTGSIRNMTARGANLAGTLYATGTIGTLSLRGVSGMIASGGGSISSISAASLTGAQILSGVNLGADAALGGTGSNADVFGQGTIGTLQVDGAISTSLIGAGLAPASGSTLGAGGDTIIGGRQSYIRTIVARGGADAATHFIAGGFGTAKLPQKVVIPTDSRFETPA